MEILTLNKKETKEVVERILQYVDENTIDGRRLLYGYHKSLFKNMPDKYELVFTNNDPEYPIMIRIKNFIPIVYGIHMQ